MSSTRTRTSHRPRQAATKTRRHGAQSPQSASGRRSPGDRPSAAAPTSYDTGRGWTCLAVAVLCLAAALRLACLEQTPLHNDEGVNGFFMMRLFHEGYYHYDPANYHGPTLYYLTLPLVYLFGMNTTALHLEPAFFGILTVAGLLALRPRLGALGAAAAALLLAVSPGAVYFSRDFIHETLLVAFTLGLVLSAARYYETARPQYLLLASASAALLFATKETAIITVAVLGLAAIATSVYLRFRRRRRVQERPRPQDGTSSQMPPASQDRARFVGVAMWAPSMVSLFLVLAALFYSSFSSHAHGVSDALKAFSIWTGTGTQVQGHPWDQYLVWLWQGDSVLLLFGATGAAVALYRADKGFAVFCAFWAFGMIAAYSLVPYKTPWLVLNFLLPLAITGSYGVAAAARQAISYGRVERRVACGVACAAFVVSVYQAVNLSFFRYDEESHPYVYVHTRREFLGLLSAVDRISQASGTREDTSILITTPDYWPLPWYLRRDRNVGYVGRIVPATGQALVIGSQEQAPALDAVLGPEYRLVGSYPLRPGTGLVLYARRELSASGP